MARKRYDANGAELVAGSAAEQLYDEQQAKTAQQANAAMLSGVNNYWGGTTSDQSRAYDDNQRNLRYDRIDKEQAQKDANYNAEQGRQNAMSLAGMWYGPEGSLDRSYKKDIAVAGINKESAMGAEGLRGQSVRDTTNLAGNWNNIQEQTRGQNTLLNTQKIGQNAMDLSGFGAENAIQMAQLNHQHSKDLLQMGQGQQMIQSILDHADKLYNDPNNRNADGTPKRPYGTVLQNTSNILRNAGMAGPNPPKEVSWNNQPIMPSLSNITPIDIGSKLTGGLIDSTDQNLQQNKPQSGQAMAFPVGGQPPARPQISTPRFDNNGTGDNSIRQMQKPNVLGIGKPVSYNMDDVEQTTPNPQAASLTGVIQRPPQSLQTNPAPVPSLAGIIPGLPQNRYGDIKKKKGISNYFTNY